MPISALQVFRDKYPQYDNKSDEDLATALATKYPDAYGMLPKTVASEKVISGYNPMTQESAKMAEERPNAWEAVANEALYNPAKNANLNVLGKTRHWAAKTPAMMLKLLGAGYQSIEGGVTAPGVTMQRHGIDVDPIWGPVRTLKNVLSGKLTPESARTLLPDMAKTTAKSITGETPTEIGDITRGMGVPEPLSQLAGLAGTTMLPGYGAVKPGLAAIRKGATKLVGSSADATVKAAARAHIAVMLRGSPDWGRYAVKNRFGFIKPGQSVDDIAGQLNKEVSNVRALVESQFKKLGDDVGKLDSKYAKTAIKIDAKKSPTRTLLKDLVDHGGISRDAKGNIAFNTPIDEEIYNAIGQIEADLAQYGGNVPLRTISGWKDKLSQIYKETNHGGVRKAINAIDEQVKLTAPKDWLKANAKYSELMDIRGGKPLEGDLSLDKLLTTSMSGVSPAERATLLKTNGPAIDALKRFEATIPGSKKFVKRLQDAIANNEAKEWWPTKTTSILGAGTVGGAVIGNPMMAAGFGGATLATSPRATSLLYQRLLSRKTTPAAKAIRDGVMSGLVDPSILKASQGMAIGGQGESYNPQY